MESHQLDMGVESHQLDIADMEDWSKKWLIELNPSKTESMVFTQKRNVNIPVLHMREPDLTSMNKTSQAELARSKMEPIRLSQYRSQPCVRRLNQHGSVCQKNLVVS